MEKMFIYWVRIMLFFFLKVSRFLTLHPLLTCVPFMLYRFDNRNTLFMFAIFYIVVRFLCMQLITYLFSYTKTDFFAEITCFGLYAICWSLNLRHFHVVLYTFVHLIVSGIIVWLTQFILYLFYYDEIIVIIGTGSADSGHFKVKAGHRIMHISKGPNDVILGELKDVSEDLDENRFSKMPLKRFLYLPPYGYGILGLTTFSDDELNDLFRTVINSFDRRYSSFYQSCQEVALKFAQKIATPSTSIYVYITTVKCFLVIISFYAIPLAWFTCKNVTFTYRE